MTVPVKPRSGPTNLHFILAFVFGAVSWWSYPAAGDWWQWWVIWFLFGFGSVAAMLAAFGGLVQDYRLRRRLYLSQAISEDHGSARQATYAEISDRGMADPARGDLLGLDDEGRPVFAPEGPFKLFEAPPGVGKTVSWVIGIILHRAMMGYSLVVPDVKAELAYQLAPTLRMLGFEVWVINPAGKFLDTVGNVELNPYQAVIDAVYADGDQRKDAVKYASDYAAIHNPLKGDEKQPYFIQGSRRAAFTTILGEAVLNPAHCTPTDAYEFMADPARFLKGMAHIARHPESHIENDPIIATLKAEAKNLLHRAEKNEENFASFLEGATQRMLAFNPAGHLGYYGRGATKNIIDLRRRQVILFIMTPLSHLREFESFISLINNNVIVACKAEPDGHPVHIVGEEFLNYFFPEVTADMETLRQLRVSADFFIQSWSGLVKRYGRDAAAAIESYSDCRVYAGLNSFDRAKMVSDMLAEATLRKQDFSYQADVKEVGISSKELGRRVSTPDEILAMPRNQAWAFIRGMRPVRITMLHYGQARPWCDWVGPSPITGTRLPADPLFEIHYPKENTDA